MAKSKKKQTAPNIAFIERIEIQIKEKARQRMLKRAPKPASGSISSTDILNQQYLLQRTLAQRIQAQPQQQSQTVNVYLGDVAKLQQQETLKRIDEDASAAILRQQRGGINQERLDFVLASLLEQKREVKKQQPPPASFEYGFVKEGAVEYKEEQRAKSVAALERLNKGSGPRSVAFESITLLPPSQLPVEQSRRRALTPEQRRALSVEAGQRSTALSKLTAQEFVQKNPDLTGEIIREGQEAIKAKYTKRRKEIDLDLRAGRLTKGDAESLLRDFATGIGYDIKPRFRAESVISSLTTRQQDEPAKTSSVVKKKSQSSAADLSSAIASNVKASISEPPPFTGGGQVEQIEEAKRIVRMKGSRRQQQSTLSQPSIIESFSKATSAAQDLQEEVP